MVANFAVSGVIHLLNELGILIHVASHNREREMAFGNEIHKDPKYARALKESAQAVESILKSETDFLSLFPSSHVKAAMTRLKHWLDREDKSFNDAFDKACRLRDAVEIELREYAFYAYPQEKWHHLRSWKMDWARVLTAFPDIECEVFEAIDCYALRHDTASVFHSMRIAEHGLRALARERKIRLPKNKPVEWATWQEVISALDLEIRQLGHQKAGPKKDEALSFYSGARADLNGFKDEYRNAVMHVRARYDEFQAQRALTGVHDFMDRLAGRLSKPAKQATNA